MNRKRILSMLLAAALMFGTFPAAFAADGDASQEETTAGQTVKEPEGGSGEGKNPAGGTGSGLQESPAPVTAPRAEDKDAPADGADSADNNAPADDASTEELVRLTWENISYELTAGTADGDPWTNEEYDNGHLITWDEEAEYHGCNSIEYSLTKDSAAGEMAFSLTCPELEGVAEPVANIARFRPGDHVGDTDESLGLEPLTDGSITVTLKESDGPWVYTILFGDVNEDEEFVAKTCAYDFELKVMRFRYLTWEDNVDFSVTSGNLVEWERYPSTEDLFTVDSDYNNTAMFYVEREEPTKPASMVFEIKQPEKLAGRDDVAARVWRSDGSGGGTAEIKELSANETVSIPVEEDEIPNRNVQNADYSVQFGVMKNGEFEPRTYEHPFAFRVFGLERMTWNDIGFSTETGSIEHIYPLHEDGDPLIAVTDEGKSHTNWIEVYVEPHDAATVPTVDFTVTPPEALGTDELFVQFYSFTRGDTSDELPDFTIEPVSAMQSLTIPVDDDQVYVYTFGVVDEKGRFIPKTLEHRFIVDVMPLAKLTWENVDAIAPDGAEIELVETYPETGDLEKPGFGGNFMEVAVKNAKEGDKVRFKVTCPAEDGAFARYLAFVKSLQSNPDGKFAEIELDDDGSFTIDVDVIGAADLTKVIHALAFTDAEGTLVTEYYHFDFAAKTAGEVVSAGGNVSDNVYTAAVTDGAIQSALTSNPEESTIYIDANHDAINSDITETTVTLGGTDVDAVTEAGAALQISTPVGTVTLPAEAVQQAKGDAENASIKLEVKALDSTPVSYQNVTVQSVKNIEVTLYRVVDGSDEKRPISMDGGAVTVRAVILEGLTLNEPLYLVYLPETGSAVLERTVEAEQVDTDSCITFTTSHLSEFALLKYDEAQKLGVFTTSRPRRPNNLSSSSSSGTAAGKVEVNAGDHGTVTASPKSAKRGAQVTLTVKPDAGYVLDSIRVTDSDGDEIRLTKDGENKYTFTMPAGNVKVSARFVADSAETEGQEEVSTQWETAFLDVAASDWYADSVAFAGENGMMEGSNGYFTPNGRLTRAMIAQVLYNMEGAPAAAASRSFPDVSASDWFSDAVAWAVGQGCMSGYGNGSFGPNDPITREQLAAVFYGYSSAKGYDVTASGSLAGFPDGSAVSDWAQTAVGWATGKGLLSGKSGGRLDPAGTATRAETAQILMNFSRNLAQ